VVLPWCETWSLTSGEEHRIRVFENRVLRRIFGPRRYEATGWWTNPLNEELRDLYSSPSIIRIIKSRMVKLSGYVTRMTEKGLFEGKLESKSTLGRPKHRWEYNIN
jgi:hypothetical protein